MIYNHTLGTSCNSLFCAHDGSELNLCALKLDG